MRALTLLTLIAVLAASCGDSSSSAHGGFRGDNAHWYDVAYRACYRLTAKPSFTYDATRRIDSLILGASGQRQMAMEAGCSAGSAKAGGSFGVITGTSRIVPGTTP